jgi:hypothetical protein
VAPGQYSYNGPDVFEAINRGEGPQAMAYFERAAKEDEQQGNLVRAARELHGVSIVANRMGRYQIDWIDGIASSVNLENQLKRVHANFTDQSLGFFYFAAGVR